LLVQIQISGNSYKLVQQQAACYCNCFIKTSEFQSIPDPHISINRESATGTLDVAPFQNRLKLLCLICCKLS